MLLGAYTKDNKVMMENTPKSQKSFFNCERYKFFLDEGAPPVAEHCCNIMKKQPIHRYDRETGKKAITGQMACESLMRRQQWERYGCNGFAKANPLSTPIAFWTEQDILEYIYIYEQDLIDWRIREIEEINGCPLGKDDKENIKAISPIYGDVVKIDPPTHKKKRDIGRTDFYVTTGAKRTGCMCCGFGCHLEKPSGYRFFMLNERYPKVYDYFMRGGDFDKNGDWRPDSRGLGMWYCIEFINKHGGFTIDYPNREQYIKKYLTERSRNYLYSGSEDADNESEYGSEKSE